MLGLIEFDEGIRKPCLTRREILGTEFLALNMGRAVQTPFSRRNSVRWARKLRDMGVRTAVFAKDFPHREVFFREGIRQPDPFPLRHALCVPCVRRALEKAGIPALEAVVAVSADHVSREVGETVRDLAAVYRYVLLAVPSGGEVFAREMRLQCGAAVTTNPSSALLERADALILFAPRPDLGSGNRVLCALYPGSEPLRGQMRFSLVSDPVSDLPENISHDVLAYALYNAGALPQRAVKCEIAC